MYLRSDDNDDDNALIPLNFVQFSLMPQFGFFDFSSFDSLVAPFCCLMALLTAAPPPLPPPLIPQLLQTFFACWHKAESEIKSTIRKLMIMTLTLTMTMIWHQMFNKRGECLHINHWYKYSLLNEHGNSLLLSCHMTNGKLNHFHWNALSNRRKWLMSLSWSFSKTITFGGGCVFCVSVRACASVCVVLYCTTWTIAHANDKKKHNERHSYLYKSKLSKNYINWCVWRSKN